MIYITTHGLWSVTLWITLFVRKTEITGRLITTRSTCCLSLNYYVHIRVLTLSWLLSSIISEVLKWRNSALKLMWNHANSVLGRTLWRKTSTVAVHVCKFVIICLRKLPLSILRPKVKLLSRVMIWHSWYWLYGHSCRNTLSMSTIKGHSSTFLVDWRVMMSLAVTVINLRILVKFVIVDYGFALRGYTWLLWVLEDNVTSL